MITTWSLFFWAIWFAVAFKMKPVTLKTDGLWWLSVSLVGYMCDSLGLIAFLVIAPLVTIACYQALKPFANAWRALVHQSERPSPTYSKEPFYAAPYWPLLAPAPVELVWVQKQPVRPEYPAGLAR